MLTDDEIEAIRVQNCLAGSWHGSALEFRISARAIEAAALARLPMTDEQANSLLNETIAELHAALMKYGVIDGEPVAAWEWATNIIGMAIYKASHGIQPPSKEEAFSLSSTGNHALDE